MTGLTGAAMARRVSVPASLIALFLLLACQIAHGATPPTGRIVVSITSGKPNAPTETVTVAWQEGAASIRAERRAAEGTVLASGEAALAEAKVVQLWRTVEEHHLTAFVPRESAAHVFDFGDRHVRLEWASYSGRPAGHHELAWMAPLDNDADVAPLLREVGALARALLPAVGLAYFPK